MNYPYNTNRGFTFIETLVSISILLIAVGAPLTLASQGLAASRIVRDQTTATYLAQEGIEYLRNLRDSNALRGVHWLQGIDGCHGNNVCTLDVTTNEVYNPSIDVCPGGAENCEPLRFRESTGAYGMNDGAGWEDTKFTRYLFVEDIDVNSEVNVHVTVLWQDGTKVREIVLRENILNWP